MLEEDKRLELVRKYNIITKDPWRSKVVRTGETYADCEVLGNDGKNGSSRTWFVHCSKCSEDPEMFGDGVFKCGIKAIDSRGVCPCNSKVFRYTEDQHKILVERKAKEQDYNFLGWVDNKYLKGDTYLRLRCSKGHEWCTTKISKFLFGNRGCPHCANNVPTTVQDFVNASQKIHPTLDYTTTRKIRKGTKNCFTVVCPHHGEFAIDQHHHVHRSQGCPHLDCVGSKISNSKAHTTEQFITKAIKVHGYTYDYSETIYHRSFSKVNIYCNICENEFTQAASDHLSGNGCPSCAGNNQKQCYVFSIEDNGNPIGCKFGIAIDYKSRLTKQNNMSKYSVRALQVYDMPDVKSCKAAEREVSESLPTKHIPKEEYLDGYTETTCITNVEDILAIYKKFGGVRKEIYE